MKKLKSFFLSLLLIIITIVSTMIWSYENDDVIYSIKTKLKKYKNFSKSSIMDKNAFNVEANAYSLTFSNILQFDNLSAYLLHDSDNKALDIKSIKIFSQNGYLITADNKRKKLNLGKNFTSDYNGGVKLIIFFKSEIYGLISSRLKDCFYTSIVNLNKGNEIFKTDCLPSSENDYIDFNGVGSSLVDFEDYILLSLGTPTTNSDKISKLAQEQDSYFGKFLKINKSDFEKGYIKPEIFSYGHRNPQGVTKIGEKIFSTEHGPKGGDELNLIEKNFNYGWPIVSYGTKYFSDEDGKSYKMNHRMNKFAAPIYAFIPSIAVSALNNCPKILQNYYKQNCLIGLSLNGNKLQPGRSLIIFLLSEDYLKIDAIEKIYIRDNFAIRHFLTNKKNEIFESQDGSIYVSVDHKGVFEVKFNNFR